MKGAKKMRMPELAFLNVYPYPLTQSHRKKFSLKASVNCTYPGLEVIKKIPAQLS